MTTGAYTTATLVKRRLRIPTGVTTHDALLADIVSEVNEAIETYTGQGSLTAQTYSELYSVFDHRTSSLGLDHFPVISIVALTVDSSAWVQNTDYYLEADTGYLHKDGQSWYPVGENIVSVTYTAGVTDVSVPKTLQRAATNWAVAEFNKSAHHGFKTETMTGAYSYTIDTEDVPQSVRAAINQYIKAFQV